MTYDFEQMRRYMEDLHAKAANFDKIEAERNKLRDELQARAEGRCRECSQHCDGGFFWPESCAVEDRMFKAREALRYAERIVDYFANDQHEFHGSGTPKDCLRVIRRALGREEVQ